MVTTDESLDLIRKKMNAIDEVKLYYALKLYKARYIQPPTLKLLKICVAIDSLGLPITSDLVDSLRKARQATIRLHGLGDRRILILKRKRGKFLEWKLNPAFKELISK